MTRVTRVTSVANCRNELNIFLILIFVEHKILKTTGIKVKTHSYFWRTMQDLNNTYAQFRLIMNMYLRDIWSKRKKQKRKWRNRGRYKLYIQSATRSSAKWESSTVIIMCQEKNNNNTKIHVIDLVNISQKALIIALCIHQVKDENKQCMRIDLTQFFFLLTQKLNKFIWRCT